MDLTTHEDSIFKEEFKAVIDAIPDSRVKIKTETIARIFKKDRAENFISDWLAFLMENNPSVLKSIFKCADVSMENLDFEIEREYVFQDNRRIDFLLIGQNTIVGIENKVDSGKLENQLKDYSKSLDKLAGKRNIVKIFLKPKSNLSEASDGFIPITYEELILEFKKIHIDFIEDLRVAFLLNDFITHVEENIALKNVEGFEFNEWTFFLSKHNKNLLTIAEETKKESINVNNFIKEKLLSIVDYSDEWTIGNDKPEPTYIQLYKKNWKNPFVHFELLRKESNSLPTKYDIRLDIELGDKNTKNKVVELLGFFQPINILKKDIEIDYTSSESFNSSINDIMDILKKYIEEYEFKIDKAIEMVIKN